MTLNTIGDIKSLNRTLLKNVTEFNYFGRNIASSEKDVQVRIAKAWGALEKPIWKVKPT